MIDIALKRYRTENKIIAKFLKFCKDAHKFSIMANQEGMVQGYPILHQLFYGRLILVNCNFKDVWLKMIKLVIDILK